MLPNSSQNLLMTLQRRNGCGMHLVRVEVTIRNAKGR